jgi:hypothetical protein
MRGTHAVYVRAEDSGSHFQTFYLPQASAAAKAIRLKKRFWSEAHRALRKSLLLCGCLTEY